MGFRAIGFTQEDLREIIVVRNLIIQIFKQTKNTFLKEFILYIVDNYGNLITTIGLPITFIILLNNRIKNADQILTDVAKLLLQRLTVENKLDSEFFNGIICSKNNSKPISYPRLSKNKVMSKLMLLIADTPFLKEEKKSELFNLIINFAKDNHIYFDGEASMSISEILAKTMTITTVLFSIVYIVTKENIDISYEISIVFYILIGFIIIVISLIFTVIIVGLANKNKIEGSFRIKNSSFRFLKLFTNEELKFYQNSKLIKFKNQGIKSKFIKQRVDTMPGVLPFEFLTNQTFQLQEECTLSFSNHETKLSIKYILRKKSAVNGSQQFDVLYIYIFREYNEIIMLSKCVESDLSELKKEGVRYFDNYLLDEDDNRKYVVSNDNNFMVVNEEFKIIEFNVENVKYKIDNENLNNIN